jgi:hypothetical protein
MTRRSTKLDDGVIPGAVPNGADPTGLQQHPVPARTEVLAVPRPEPHHEAMRTIGPARRFAILVGGIGVAAALAVGPVFGVDPVPGPDSTDTGRHGPPIVPPGQARQKAPSTPITVRGTVGTTTDEEGRTTYTLDVDGTTYELSAGPAWFWDQAHPLAGHVGDQVEVVGAVPEGSNEVDVETVDGVALREPGKPPWAGGPKRVGERHPGWKAWIEAHPDGNPGNGHGRDGAPGQSKKSDEAPAP